MRQLRALGLAIVVSALLAGAATAQNSDDICASMLVPLIEQAGLIPESSAPALGCRQDDGTWFMPTVAEAFNDRRIEQLSSEARELLDAVDRMSTDPAFGSSLQFLRQEAIALVPGPGGVEDAVDISDYGLGVAPTWLHNVQDGYNQSMQTYLTRTVG